MRQLYSLLIYLLLPFIFLRLWLRGSTSPDYRRRWGERLGYLVRAERGPSIWVHAVSVGEAQAAAPLLKALRHRYPQFPLIVTTTTATGLARAQALVGDSAQVAYVPYDTPGSVRRFLDRAQPGAAIIMETELWPNLFHACSARRIPLLIVNARLSEKSARGYARVAALTRATLDCVTVLAAQGRADGDRFVDLGLDPRHLQVTGNIKFDLAVPDAASTEAARLRDAWGSSRPTWVAASTHEGEEAAVLEAHARVRDRYPDALLIGVPRHPERFAAVAGLCADHGYRVTRRGSGAVPDAATDIYLGDTLGELMLLYAAADVAFVGGSLAPIGGHNMLEPAALGVPVIAGLHTHNFVEVTDLMLAAGAARQVESAGELGVAVGEWFADLPARVAAGSAGKELVVANRGATERVLALIGKALSE